MTARPSYEDLLERIRDLEARTELEKRISDRNLELALLNERLEAEIIEHKSAVTALRASEEKYRDIFEGVSDFLFRHDLQGLFTDANPASRKAFGYSENPSPILTLQEMLPDEIAHLYSQYIETVKTVGRSEGLTRLKKKDGQALTVEYKTSLVVNDEGVPIGVRGSGRDVTKEARTKAALKQSQRRLCALLNAVTETLMLIDPGGTILVANEVAASRLGARPDELPGRCVFGLLDPDIAENRKGSINEVIRTGKPLRTTDRRAGRVYDTHWFPLSQAAGRVEQIAVFAIDITEARTAEEERVRAEKLESIRVLSAGIAHDFNNLLTALLGFVELALVAVDQDARARVYLKEAKKTCRRAVDLTQRFSALADHVMPLKQPGALEDVVRQSAALALAGTQNVYEIKATGPLWPVEFDRTQIGNVLTAVLTNAKEASPDGGKITITLENCALFRLPSGSPPFAAGGEYVKIAIRDRGTGIPPAHLTRLFDPYFSTKARGAQKGMGLGLASSYAIIKNHGGFIDVSSQVGAGTTVSIHIPAAGNQRPPLAPSTSSGVQGFEPAKPGEPPDQRRRILVMDDEEMILEILEQMLHQAGYEPVMAKDVDESLRLFLHAKETGRPFDAMIFDLTIRGGMGGKEIMEAIRQIDPSAKGILSTGYVDDPAMREFRAFGFAGAVPKPYDFNQLKSVLEAVLGGTQSTKTDN